MAHVGQELALRPVGDLGSFLGLPELGLGLLTLGDVERRADVAEELPVGVKMRVCAIIHPAHAAVGPHDPVF